MNFRDSAEFIKVEAELNHLNQIMKYEKNDNPRDLNLEDFLAILRVHNIVIGNFIRNNMTMIWDDFESSTDIMPGYDLSYNLFEEIGENLNEYESESGSRGRSEESISEELFSCLVTYIEMSTICGRHGWSDVNKRAAGLMSHLLIRYDYLVERLEEIIKNEGWTMQFSPTRLALSSKIEPGWVSEFLNAVLKEYKEHEEAN